MYSGWKATATSGLVVSFSYLTASTCTIVGNIGTGVTTGTCTIVAKQAGNVAYAAALQVTQSFPVTIPLSNQSISFAALPIRLFNAGPFPVSATDSSGLPVSFSSITPSCSSAY